MNQDPQLKGASDNSFLSDGIYGNIPYSDSESIISNDDPYSALPTDPDDNDEFEDIG